MTAMVEEKKYEPQRKRRIPPMALSTMTRPARNMAPPRTGKHRQQLLHHIRADIPGCDYELKVV